VAEKLKLVLADGVGLAASVAVKSADGILLSIECDVVLD
jgi:hypothetical protein